MDLPSTLRVWRSSRVVRWVDHVVLPAVTVLLIVGAFFVVLAWVSARSSLDAAAQVDGERAQRGADAVSQVVRGRQQALADWVATARPDPANTRAMATLRRSIASWSDFGSDHDEIARIITDERGNAVASAERHSSSLITRGIADDVQAFARQVIARGAPRTSDRMPFGSDIAFAIGVPIGAASTDSAQGARGALVVVYGVGDGPIGLFMPTTNSDASSATTLRDARGRRIAGSTQQMREDSLRRRIIGTQWTLKLARQQPVTMLPMWTYPFFAAVLLSLGVGYSIQEIRRRRFQRERDTRAQQVRRLFELSTQLLHASDHVEQARCLAVAMLELVEAQRAEVLLEDHGMEEPFVAGDAREQAGYDARVDIPGATGTLGELVVWRELPAFDDDELGVVHTAAALTGAALQTTANLEAERAAGAELQRLDDLRSNLMATVAHELRSPVTAVKGVLGLLSMQEELPAKTQEYVGVATERTNRLVELIQDLFDCSLIETGQLDIRLQRQPALPLLESALGAHAAAHPGELVLSATPNLMITVDPVRFDQLVGNLVTNAFRHGAPPVEVSVRPADGGVVIVVSDEGAGIEPADRERIFGKFWQGSRGHARLVEGAGLGMSLVQGLVALHGGTIRIDSAHIDGRGARFTVWLPDNLPA